MPTVRGLIQRERLAVLDCVAKQQSNVAAKSALLAFCAYFLITMSKRFWLASLQEPIFWVADALCFVALPLLLISLLKLPVLPTMPIAMTRGSRPGWALVLFYVFLSLLGMMVVGRIGGQIAINMAQHFPDVLPQVISYSGHIPKSPPASVVTIVYLAVTAGFVEEYFFRGLLNPLVCKYLGNSVAVFVTVSSLSFAAIHWGGGLANVIGSLPFGVFLALVYVRTGDIRVPVLAHTAYWLRWLF